MHQHFHFLLPNFSSMNASKSISRSLLLAPFFLLLLFFMITIKNYNPSLDPFQLFLSVSLASSNLTTTSNELRNNISRDECDVFKGEWIGDSEAPYYTNRTCGTIQEHQNCMKYGRPDVGFLRWRWRPDGCEMRRFDAGRFLEMMRGRSMAFVGDSIARNHMQSLMCLLSKVAHPEDISQTKDENFKLVFYANHNFTISIFWSPFLIRARQSDTEGPNGTGLWDLYLDEPDDAWATEIDKFDYLVISGGNWFTRPSMFYENQKLIGCHYCLVPNVTDLTLRYSHKMAFRTAFGAINDLSSFKGMVILRTVSPSHFEHGEWNQGGDCVRTSPYKRNEAVVVQGIDHDFYDVQVEEFVKAGVAGRRRRLEFRLMDVTRAMLLRPDGHPSRFGHWAHENVTLYNDCVHWCLPGPIDSWGDFLLHLISVNS